LALIEEAHNDHEEHFKSLVSNSPPTFSPFETQRTLERTGTLKSATGTTTNHLHMIGEEVKDVGADLTLASAG
jgi:hypothetical protein